MKVLLYLPYEKLAPKGGPLGVGYNINQELKRRGITTVEFYHDNRNQKSEGKIGQLFKWLKSYMSLFYFPTEKKSDLFNQYDIVHFQSVKDFYRERRAIKKFKGKTVLTSHSPVPMALEMYEDIKNKFPKFKSELLLKKLKKIDEYAFSSADFIIFPCEYAEEPYINNWKEYSDIRARRKSRYFYCPTGIVPSKAKRSEEDVKKELNLQKDTFLISYVGRHNAVKGYDTLKKIGSQILARDEKVSFVICGKEYPMSGLEHERWIEIGWTNDAHSYINAADVFVLPNKETFFDLIMLEVLSLGKIVVASRTGGNKFFEEHGVKGVFLYNTLEEAVEIIEKIKTMSKEERLDLENQNKEYFEKNLTVSQYLDKYLGIISQIANKEDGR